MKQPALALLQLRLPLQQVAVLVRVVQVATRRDNGLYSQ